MSPSPGELHNRLSILAKEAADDAGLRPNASAQEVLGTLVNQAAEEIGPEPGATELEVAERAFRRLAREVAADRRPAGDGDAEEQLREAAMRPIDVSGPELRGILEKLCPGFFPFC